MSQKESCAGHSSENCRTLLQTHTLPPPPLSTVFPGVGQDKGGVPGRACVERSLTCAWPQTVVVFTPEALADETRPSYEH